MRAVLLGLAMLVLLAVGPARADDPIYLVQYIDVSAAGQSAAAKAIGEARTAGRKADGNLSFDAYAEAGRPTRFVIVSLWRDQKAVDAYSASPVMKGLTLKLDPLRVTPFDQRWLTVMGGDAPGAAAPAGRPVPGKRAVYVVTHMDSIPPFKDKAAEFLKQLADASVKQPGVVRYQVLVQTNRPNHFKLLEVWADQTAFATHVASKEAKQFRELVQEGTGSPYDERLYKTVP